MDSGKFVRSQLTTWLVALAGIALISLALSGVALADDTPPVCGGYSPVISRQTVKTRHVRR